MVRQGDVLLILVDDAPASLRPSSLDDANLEPEKDPRGVVLADGESSQHFHEVAGAPSKLFRFRDSTSQRLLVTGNKAVELRVVGGGSGGVARHEPIGIAPGKYLVRTQRSWTSEHRARQVAD